MAHAFTMNSTAAKNFTKMRKASQQFAEVSVYGWTLSERLSRHCNGNPNEPFRKMEKFIEHNTAAELAEIGRLSEQALYLTRTMGIKHELCHLTPVSRGSKTNKVNNVSNLIVLTQVTNQIINRRSVSREAAQFLDELVLSGEEQMARRVAKFCCA